MLIELFSLGVTAEATVFYESWVMLHIFCSKFDRLSSTEKILKIG